jgi:hypothetical protein
MNRKPKLKEVLMPVLSPSALPFDPSTGLRAGFAQDKLRINSVEGLNDVNQTKQIRKPPILNRKGE